jgi:hypothetical protein
MKMWLGKLEEEHMTGQASAKARMAQREAELLAAGAPLCKHQGCHRPAAPPTPLCFTHGIL